MNKVDVFILGAGPIGLACGIEAKKAGLSYVIVDKGCIVNSIYNYPKNMTFFSTSERLEIGGVPFISHGTKPTRTEALEYYTRVADSWELNLSLYEEIESIAAEEHHFKIQSTRNLYTAANVIIASGFYDIPFFMNIPGENLPKVRHYYNEPYPYFRQKIVVIGAANSAVDVALETYRKGAEVTMVVREPSLSSSVKYWVKPDIENRIKEGSIPAYFNSRLVEIKERSVLVETPDGTIEMANDFVLAMTGYQVDFNLLKKAGVLIGDDEMRTPYYDQETHETNVQGIYLAGVVCGGLKTNQWFIENSRVHADMIIKNITARQQASV
jgi:thioredoxin reductase (NADPH)